MVSLKHKLTTAALYVIALAILFFALQVSIENILGLPFYSLLASTSTMAWKLFFTTTVSLRFLLNILILGYLFTALLAISGRPVHSLFAITALAIVIALAEYNFFKNLDTVFSLDYLNRIHEFLVLLHTGFFPTYAVVFTVMAFSLFALAIIYLWKKERPIALRWRMTWALIFMTAIPFMASPSLLGRSLLFFNLDLVYQSREIRHAINGLPAALLTDYYYALKRWHRVPPEGYSEQTFRSMVPPHKKPLPPPASSNQPIRIILYLMESYWDPVTTFPGSITPDPLRPIKELVIDPDRSFRGRTAVPVFGGGTIQTEFEVLTGLSANAFGEFVYPHLNGPVESIASYYRSLDPTRQAIFMTADRTSFFNRHVALPHFGINHMLEGKDMLCTDTGGSWHGRTEECLITETIRLLSASDAPMLLMLEGVQNHADYTAPVHTRPFRIAEAIPEADRSALRVHANHLHDMSEQLVRLVRFIDKSEHPTILLAYGDHLPPRFAFITDERTKPQDWKATPFLLHANFPLPPDVRQWLKNNPLPATYELNAMVQLTAGIPLSPAARAILSWRRDCPPQTEPSQISPECARRHRLLTYDMVLGNRYAARDATRPEAR